MSSWWRDPVSRRDLLVLAVIGLLVQGYWAARLEHPTYFDAYYYTVNAQRLATGQGFTEEIIWQYLDNPTGIPHPSFTYWMPLPGIIAAAGYAVTGTFRGAQIPFWLMAGLMGYLSYLIGWRLTRERWLARTAALFTIAGGYYAAYWTQPSTFVLFGWVGGLFLLWLGYAQENGRLLYWFGAGLMAGLGHLSRADGVLLLGLGGLLRLGDGWRLWRGRQSNGVPSGPGHWLAQVALFGGGYLLIMGGWFWRTYQLIGTPLSTVGTQTIFLTEYNDVFSYGRTFTLASYLDWGWFNIIQSKLQASLLALGTFIAVTGLTVFVIFMVLGWIVLARKEETQRFLRPFTWYTIFLYVVMALVFTFPGQRGSLLHSSTALWPWSMALAVAGVDVPIRWLANSRDDWEVSRARRMFLPAFVLMVFVITAVVSQQQPLGDEEAIKYEAVAAIVEDDAIIMIGSPPDFNYHTSLRAVVVPNESAPTLVTIADRYGVDYLVLNPDRPPVLRPFYEGEESHPRIRRLEDLGDGFLLYAFVEASP